MLAPYAVTEANSRGRQHATQETEDRNAFQRDYARIIHSRAVGRLQGKTQVFSSNRGDLFRTRMSHSMEVEQVARSLARSLDLNEDLCGVLAIAHDLGHAPFGHLGQDVLEEMMGAHGGFEHNLQALRIVDELESPYVAHEGLNLMFETREGLLKHCTRERAQKLGDVGRRHLDGSSPPLEVQLVDWADAIAYVHADLEDAYRMKLLDLDQLYDQVPGYAEAWKRIEPRLGMAYPHGKTPADAKGQRQARAVVHETITEMMRWAMVDLVAATSARIEQSNVQTLDHVRASPPLVGFSAGHLALHRALKKFSRETIYVHPDVMSVRSLERVVLESLFRAYEKAPEEMTGRGIEPGKDFYQGLADHLSGMTDQFAHREFERLKQNRPELLEPPKASRMKP